ncbi:uncharacterized protein LOC117643495 isoform X2 [Thrips palmi]|uniref:Uncharacterized protein LOC117643495 isoform X2 n=1 Tax=Thrips palmi TaxID=161013 RepID=A0A6P8YN98_THRPL|nr:uncharacterized protein LOC117643495 isoform X2 [Thrips palmi]
MAFKCAVLALAAAACLLSTVSASPVAEQVRLPCSQQVLDWLDGKVQTCCSDLPSFVFPETKKLCGWQVTTLAAEKPACSLDDVPRNLKTCLSIFSDIISDKQSTTAVNCIKDAIKAGI